MTDGSLVRRHTSADARGRRSRGVSRSFHRRRLSMEWLESRQLLTAEALSIDSTYEPTSLMVQFRPGTRNVSSLAAYSAGNEVGDEWAIAPGVREVQISTGTDLKTALTAYKADANVLFAEPNYRVRLNMIPTDPQFGDMWNLRNTGQPPGSLVGADIRAPEAWDVTTGSPSVVVAVIDSGVDYNHPDLAANMWTNPGEVPDNGIDDDGNGFVDDIHGYDFVNHDGDPMDDYFHGTHVAGTIAAMANNGVGVVGVAPGVKIMALKFLDGSGNGVTSDAIAALNYAVANGAKISNNSWGGLAFSETYQAALQNAANAGHIFVAAAGNDATNNDSQPFYPASYNVPNVVSVAATDPGDSIAWFSNYGKKSVDLAAPGADILSTLPMTMTPGMLDEGVMPEYGTLSGTSMAAPHVAGAIALVWSLHPGWTSQEVIQQVLSTTKPLESLASTTISGGRLDLAAALGIPRPDNTPPRIVQSDPTGPVAGPVSHIRLTFSEPINAATLNSGDVGRFVGPAGNIAVLAINPVPENNRQFDIVFEPQVAIGDYALLLGPHIADMAGNELDQNGDGSGGLDGEDDYTASFSIADSFTFSSPDVPLWISGFDAFASYLTINDDLPIADVNVHLDLTFPRDDNLRIWLVSPSGTIIDLSNRSGGDAANFENTTFDDEAGTRIGEGVAPFNGSFRPHQALSSLDGASARGTWGLFIQNVSDTDDLGTLNAWSLQIKRGEGGNPVNHPPVAVDDAVTAVQNVPLVIQLSELLANDSDADGDPLRVIATGNVVGGSAVLSADGTILFTPQVGRLTPGSFQYRISDGASIATANVTVLIDRVYFLHNLAMGPDVNNDGHVAPNDALLVINQLNAFGSTSIASIQPSAVKLYFDVVADNIVAANDALEVINYINANETSAGNVSLVSAAGVNWRNSATGASDLTDDSTAMSAPAVDQCLAAGEMDLLLGDPSPWMIAAKRRQN